MVTNSPISVDREIGPQPSREARTAAIAGTRQLVAESSFDALLSLLVLSGAVPKDRARAMLTDVAEQLTAYREAGHAEWNCHPGELALQADRLRRQAESLS